MLVGLLGLGVFGQDRRGYKERRRRTDEDHFRNPHLEFPVEKAPVILGPIVVILGQGGARSELCLTADKLR